MIFCGGSICYYLIKHFFKKKTAYVRRSLTNTVRILPLSLCGLPTQQKAYTRIENYKARQPQALTRSGGNKHLHGRVSKKIKRSKILKQADKQTKEISQNQTLLSYPLLDINQTPITSAPLCSPLRDCRSLESTAVIYIWSCGKKQQALIWRLITIKSLIFIFLQFMLGCLLPKSYISGWLCSNEVQKRITGQKYG